jgi:hypothetical protein
LAASENKTEERSWTQRFVLEARMAAVIQIPLHSFLGNMNKQETSEKKLW